MSEIRYRKITLVDGTHFILRVTSESPKFVHGYEVNAEGDEIVPPGYQNRHRSVERTLIAKAVEMRMNNKYATLEVVPAGERAKKTAAQLDAEIAEALNQRRSQIPPSYRRYVEEAAELIDRGESEATILRALKFRGLTDSEAQLILDAAK